MHLLHEIIISHCDKRVNKNISKSDKKLLTYISNGDIIDLSNEGGRLHEYDGKKEKLKS